MEELRHDAILRRFEECTADE
eukprot:COSAG05_NODE_21472_length_271_cov_1.209302_1_plen_20_part_01